MFRGIAVAVHAAGAMAASTVHVLCPSILINTVYVSTRKAETSVLGDCPVAT